MSTLFSSLGIDWRLFISQGVNFLILLAVLTVLIWRPLLNLLEERRKKIELGVKAGQVAQLRLDEIEQLKNKSIAKSEFQAEALIKSAEKDAEIRSLGILEKAHKQGQAVIVQAAATAERSRLSAMESLSAEAENLIKDALIRIVELDPSQIDAKLVTRVATALAEESRL